MVRTKTSFTMGVVFAAVFSAAGAEVIGQIRGFVPQHQRSSVLRRTRPSRAADTYTAPLHEPGEMPVELSADASDWELDLPPAPPDPLGLADGLESKHTSGSRVVQHDEGPNPLAGTESVADLIGSSVGHVDTRRGGWDSSPTCGGTCGICTSCRTGGLWIDTFSINVGVQGATSGVNRGESGSFGFQEGFNWGSPWMLTPLGMNTQIGYRSTQSNFNGSEFTHDHRVQHFITAGLYTRSCHGWQGGIVYDHLHDDWYASVDLAQLRGELSYAVPNGSSVGVWFATPVSTDETSSVLSGGQSLIESWETHDIYAAFYKVQSNRHRLGQWRVFAGFTGGSDGIIGSDFKVPLAGTWSLEPAFTYVIPDEATGAGGNQEEAWNVVFNLVWYPARARGSMNYDLLPMFDVADNGSMVVRRR